jgi:hypothetical protein
VKTHELVEAEELRHFISLIAGTYRLSRSERLQNLVVGGFLCCLVVPLVGSIIASRQNSVAGLVRSPIAVITFLVVAALGAAFLINHAFSSWSFSPSAVSRAAPFSLSSWSIPVVGIAGITLEPVHGGTALVIRPHVGKRRRIALISGMRSALGVSGA